MTTYPLTMDRSSEIGAAVADVFAVLRQVRDEDLASGAIVLHDVERVEADERFAVLTSKQSPNMLDWALKLDRSDPRLSSLHDAAKLFAELANVAPYNTRPNDGWEVVNAIAITSQAFDFMTGAEFDLAAVQMRVREALLRDQMVERTIWGLFGLEIEAPIKIGERSWLLPATNERRSHVARPKLWSYPLIHAHGYLLSDRVTSSEELRTAKRDSLPGRLLSSLRVVARPDMLTMGPWYETTVILPSRFAGFTTDVRAPELPLSYSYPANDVRLTSMMANEAAQLDALMHTEPSKSMKSQVRSIQLAVDRLSMATSRSTLPDALLDLMIGLESLLSKQGEKTEITYRIALRGAYACLADTAERRAVIRKMLSEAYNLRSEVVHGAKRDPEIPTTAVKELRTFITSAIRLSAFALQSGVPLVEQIELALLGDRQPLEATIAKLSQDNLAPA